MILFLFPTKMKSVCSIWRCVKHSVRQLVGGRYAVLKSSFVIKGEASPITSLLKTRISGKKERPSSTVPAGMNEGKENKVE